MTWSALVVPATLDSPTVARVAATPVPHAWSPSPWGPAPLFAVPDLSRSQVLALGELLSDLDLAWLRDHPGAPRLYDARPRLSGDGPPPETWLATPWILAGARPVDCKALAAWRRADLRLRGEPASLLVDARPDGRGGVSYHLRVGRASGAAEDPQAALRSLSRYRPSQ